MTTMLDAWLLTRGSEAGVVTGHILRFSLDASSHESHRGDGSCVCVHCVCALCCAVLFRRRCGSFFNVRLTPRVFCPPFFGASFIPSAGYVRVPMIVRPKPFPVEPADHDRPKPGRSGPAQEKESSSPSFFRESLSGDSARRHTGIPAKQGSGNGCIIRNAEAVSTRGSNGLRFRDPSPDGTDSVLESNRIGSVRLPSPSRLATFDLGTARNRGMPSG